MPRGRPRVGFNVKMAPEAADVLIEIGQEMAKDDARLSRRQEEAPFLSDGTVNTSVVVRRLLAKADSRLKGM